MQSNIYTMVTNNILEQLNKGIVPWHRPWDLVSGAISHTTGKPYSLLNQFLLCGKSGEYVTFNQVKAQGGFIKRGERSKFVVFWKDAKTLEIDEEGNENERHFPVLRYYNVWHIDQCEGVSPKHPVDDNGCENLVFVNKSAEKIIENYFQRESVTLNIEKSNKAYYCCDLDEVHVPLREQYMETEEFYSTLFHEMIHSTGHASRLNRINTQKKRIGRGDYAREELVAEIGAAFLINKSGIDSKKVFKNNVAYIQSWSKQLKQNPRLIVSAAGKAEAAVEYIMGGN